jgi:hypothetical protein
MQTRTVDRWTRLVGVALLVTAGFSTGLEHAHPGGLHPHDHHGGALRELANGSSSASEEATWFATPLHMHIFLLGFQFTLPTQESASDEPAGGGEHMLVVRLMGDDLTDPAPRLPMRGSVMPTETAPNAAILATIEPGSGLSNCRSSAALCDTARHERSGVLRI